MSKENNIINESKIIFSQQKAWTEYNLLYIINKGSVWRAFNESAYVLSALLHYKLTRRMKKKDTTFVDSVSFLTVSLEKVLSKITTDGGEIVEREDRKIIYRWNKDIVVPEEFCVVRGKDIPKNLRMDEETNSTCTVENLLSTCHPIADSALCHPPFHFSVDHRSGNNSKRPTPIF